MYKLCKTEQSAQRQRELEQGLLAIMNSTRYEDITVSDMCQKLNIPRKSFYRYFSSKDGALHALIDHTLMEFEFAAPHPQTGKRSLRGYLEGFFQFWMREQALLDALERSGLSGVLIERAIGYSISDGTLPSNFLMNDDARMRHHIMMFAACGLMTIVVQWHHGGYQESVADMAKAAVRLLTHPLFPQAENIL